MTAKLKKHQWRVNPILENWQKCECGAERRRNKGIFYYLADSKTYCPNHYCPECQSNWSCGERGCKTDEETLCSEHDTRKVRERLGGKWAK